MVPPASLPATEAVTAEDNALAVASHALVHEPNPESQDTSQPNLEPEHEPQALSSHSGAGQESAPAPDAAAEAYERRHVHAVYARIADHFSATRHKPWPLVSSFLAQQTPGSVGLDLGCGNGKYLGINPDVWLVGSDRSAELAALAMTLAKQRGAVQAPTSRGRGAGEGGGEVINHGGGRDRVYVKDKDKAIADDAQPAQAQHATEETEPASGGAGADVLVADGLDLPFRGGRADFAICIAVLHHFSTRRRRVDATRAVLETLRRGGRALLYVWALEQGSSRRGWNEGGDQDLLVPWVVQENKKGQKKSKGPRMRGEETDHQEVEVQGKGVGEAGDEKGEQKYQRYYHLYCKGELEDEVLEAGGSILEGGYEKDNWWVIATR